ncbi:hypothetical protein [Streptomyces lanatus]|uniref:MFS transporter n=1 Tax=Streptomyces lanatus TaxID=66900 RepID=A0ABV1Y5X7_9ACTN|nr:hypothetical protein [Streptomyces lanatus]GHH15224.1 hypothetical protein GCM10018780_56660 [Streptomyces lanatus]
MPALTNGFSAAFLDAAIIAAVGGIVTLLAMRTERSVAAAQPQPQAEERMGVK